MESTTLTITGLGGSVSHDNLFSLLDEFGPIISIDMERGGALVRYEERRSAEDAQADLDGVKIQGERVSVKHMSRKLRITNIDPSTSYAQIRKLVESYGPVKEMIMKGGVVETHYIGSSQKAFQGLSKLRVNGSVLSVDYV